MHVVVRPNRVVALHPDIPEVRLGPVQIGRRHQLSDEILKEHENIHLAAPDGEATYTIFHGPADASSGTLIHVPDLCWAVTVQGMPKQLEDTVRWMIDVTVSFVRLHFRESVGLFPGLKDVEAHAIDRTPFDIEGVRVTEGQLYYGGGIFPGPYEVDATVAEAISSPASQAKLEALLDPRRDTVAERLQQMLGWLTRGRRTGDHAERVLFFFTATEALLSPKGGDGPVTQTIVRYASVLFSNDVERRAMIARDIIALYGVRSRVVHRGERTVAEAEASDAHALAWRLAFIALEYADLSAKHDDFLAELKQASYGAQWPRGPQREWCDPVI